MSTISEAGVSAEGTVVAPEAPSERDVIAAEAPVAVATVDQSRLTLLDVDPTKLRMENLDTLRIVAMLVIIVTHITQPYVDHFSDRRPYGGTYNSIFGLNVALRFGVPCFMMISFFIYWHQLYAKGRSWGELLKRRLRRLVPAFVCWSLFYFALHKVLERSALNVDPGPLGERLNWKQLWTWKEVFLLGRAHEHLYYLPVVICSLLLIPLLHVLWRKPAVAWTWIGGTMVAWTVVAYGSAFWPEQTAVGRVAGKAMWLWQNVLAIPLLVFPLMGMMCAGQGQWRQFVAKTPTRFWVGMMVLGIAMHVAETLAMLNLGTKNQAWHQALAGLKVGRFVTAVPIFVLFLRRVLMKDPFPKVSHYAFGLHFMHPAIIIGLTILEGWLFGINPMQFWDHAGLWEAGLVLLLMVNFALTFFITFGLCLLVGRVKRLEFLVV